MNSYQTLDEKQAILALWYVTNTSLVAFYKLTKQFGTAKNALLASQDAWQNLGIHTAHLKRHQDSLDVLALVERIYQQWQNGAYGVLFVGDKAYPKQLLEIYDPPPILFYQGNVARLNDRQIAMVGSRKATEYAQKLTFDMAQYLACAGLTVTSGLAGGIDKSAHLGALACNDECLGRTVGVMGTGIDVCYPKNHHALYAQIIQAGGCLVSEFLPTTPASKHTFPKRNRLVAGLSLATVVTEAAMQSGSLITARLTAEQGKQVFAVPSLIDNPNAEGCHHLIREGATLVYHPSQILEDIGTITGEFLTLPKVVSQEILSVKTSDDLALPKASSVFKVQTSVVIPEHLQALFAMIKEPVDLDFLVFETQLETGVLLGWLLELELLGVIEMVGGRYARV